MNQQTLPPSNGTHFSSSTLSPTSLLDSLPGMAYRCRNDANWTIEFASLGTEALTGYSPNVFIGNRTHTFADIILEEDRQAVNDAVHTALSNRTPYQLSYRIRTADGHIKWVWEQGQGIFDGETVEALEGFITDITPLRQQQAITTSDAGSQQMQLAADLAQSLTTIRDLEPLLNEVVSQLQSQFHLYHVHVYLLDETQQQLVMAKGAGAVGAQLRAQNHRIDLHHPASLVARAARSKEMVVVPDVREAPDFLPNPLLPETKTEVAVPLIVVGGRVVGVLDIQDNTPNRFSDTDLSATQTVAGLVATALQNAELFTQVEENLALTRIRLEVSQSLAQANTDTDVLDVLFETVANVAEAQVLSLMVNGTDEDKIATVYRVLTPPDRSTTIAPGVALKWNEYSIARLIDGKQKIFYTNNVHEDPELNPSARVLLQRSNSASVAVITIHAGDHVAAVLTISSERPNFFDSQKIALYETIADQGSIAMRTARLAAQVQQSLTRTTIRLRVNQAVSSTQTEDEVAEALFTLAADVVQNGQVTYWKTTGVGDDRVSMLIQSQTPPEGYHPLPLGFTVSIINVPLTRELEASDGIFLTGNALTDPRIDDETRALTTQTGNQSFLIVSLRTGDEYYGSLSVASIEENAFDDNVVLLFRTIAERGSLAIRAARLKDQVQFALDQTNIRLNISQAFASTQNEEDVLETMIRRAGFIPGAHVTLATVDFNDPDLAVITRRSDSFDSTVPPLPVGARFTKDEFPIQKLITPNTPFISGDLAEDPRVDDATRMLAMSVNASSGAIFPMTESGTIIGWVTVLSDQPYFFNDPAKAYLYDSLTEQGTVALTKARFQANQDRAEEERRGYTLQLQTTAQLATRLNSILDLDELLTETVTEMQSRFDLYHVHIYLLDETSNQLVMAKGSGAVGEELRARSHGIAVDQPTSLVARAARSKEIVVVPDVTESPDFLPNPLLPDTKTEVAVPLVVGGKVLGVLDIQDDTPHRFGESDLSVAQTVAGLVATALQNAELFAQVEQSLTLTGVRLEINQALAAATTEAEVVETLFQSAAKVTESQVIYSSMQGTGDDRLLTVYKMFTPPGRTTSLTPGVVLPVKFYPVMHLVEGPRKTFITNNREEDPNVDEMTKTLFRRSNSLSVAIVPIWDGDVLAALITVSSDKPDFFDERLVVFYDTIAERGSLALRAARLNDQVELALQQANVRLLVNQAVSTAQRELEVQDTLFNLAAEVVSNGQVTYWVTTGLGDDRLSTLYKSQTPTEGYNVLPTGLQLRWTEVPLSRELDAADGLFLTGNAFTDARVDENVRQLTQQTGGKSFLIVALRTEDEFFGSLAVSSRLENAFDDNVVLLFKTLAERGSLALRTARLNDQVQFALQQTRIRLNISQDLNQAQTEEDVLDALIRQAGFITGAHVTLATVDFADPDLAVIIRRSDSFESTIPPFPLGIRFTPDAFPIQKLITPNNPFISGDLTTDPQVDEATKMLAMGMNAASGGIFPFTDRGTIIGWATVLSTESYFFNDPTRVYLYESLTEQGMVALTKARLQAAAERERALLNGVINSLPAGVTVVDAEGKPLLVNQTIAQAEEAAQRGDTITLYDAITREPMPEAYLPMNQTLQTREMASNDNIYYPTADGHFTYVLANSAPLRGPHGEFMGVVGTYTDITQQKEAEQALLTSTRQLQTAAELAGRINTILDLDELLTETVSELQQQFDLYHVHIYLRDYENNSLVMLKGSGTVGEAMRARHHSIPMDQERSLVARAARSEQIVVVDDVTQAPDFFPNPMLPDTKSEAAIPLTTGGRTIGVLDVQDDQVNRFSATELSVLQTLGGLIASTLQNANLFEQVAQNLRETRLRLQVSQALATARGEREVVDVIFEQATSIGTAQVTYFTVTGEGDEQVVTVQRVHAPSAESRPLPVGLKLPWADLPIGALQETDANLFVTGNSLTDERVSEKLRAMHRNTGILSYIALPIGNENEIYAFITAASPQENAFDENAINLYQTIAERGSLALREGRLYDQVELSLKQTNIRFEVSQALARAQTEEEVLDAMIRQAGFFSGAQVTLATVDFDDTELAVFTRRSDGFDSAVPPMPVGARFTKAEFPIQALITPDAPFISGNLVEDPRVDDATRMLALGLGVKSGGIFPVTDSGKIVGWATVLSDQFQFFDDPTRGYLYESLAEQGAVALRAARLFDETERTAVRLKELDRLKSEFLANMSHELRTPLNSIIGYAEIMLMGINGPLEDETVEDVQAIRNSGQHLLRLINDILDLAKIEAGRMTLDLDTVNLASLFEEIRLAHAALVHKKEVELTVSVEPDTLTVMADRLRLSQVLTNLVSNAVKFTEKGYVRIHAARERDWIRIDVADTGIGIATQNLEAIFEEFRQEDGSSTRRAEGTGLGLAISRRLIQMHSGVITVESEVDKGSMFTVYIPIVPNPDLN